MANATTTQGLIHMAVDANTIAVIVMQNHCWISESYGMQRNLLLQTLGRLNGRLQKFPRVQSSGLVA